MERIHWMVAALLASSSVAAFVRAPARESLPPNLIVFMADDLSDSIYDRAAERGYVPNIEALRARSHEFVNHITTTPLCCPARASFFTGQLASSHGVWNNGRGHEMDTSRTVAMLLQAAGYDTALVGKYLNQVGDGSTALPFHQPSYIAPGWNHWYSILKGSTRMYGFELNENGVITRYDDDYQTDLVAVRALHLLGQVSEPFFLYVASTAVHGESGIASLQCDAGTHDDWLIRPAPRHGDTSYVPAPRPPSYNEVDVSDKPWAGLVPPLTESEQQCIDVLFSSRVAALRALDDLVGAVVAAMPPNTAVAFISDQPYLFGEHRLVSKAVPYEEAIRSRAFFSRPGQVTNEIHDALVAMVDWSPTLLDLANVTPPPEMDGVSLSCILEGSCRHVRTRISLFQWKQPDKNGGELSFTGWRTGPNDPNLPNAVWWSWKPSGAQEGYDLETDPYQLDNLR